MPSATGTRTAKVKGNGTIRARRIEFLIGRQYANQTAYVLYHDETLEFFDHRGTFIAEADWPVPGISYVSADKLRPKPLAANDVGPSATVTDVPRQEGTVTDVPRHSDSVTDVSTHQPSPES